MARRRFPSRRGSVYVLVLGAAMVVTVVGVTALTATRVQLRSAGAASDDLLDARLIARSAMEIGMYHLSRNADWRPQQSGGAWTLSSALGYGRYEVEITDPADGNLADNVSQAVRARFTGTLGNARAVTEVTLIPQLVDVNAHRYAVLMLQPLAYWPLLDATGATTAVEFSQRYPGTYRVAHTSKAGEGTVGDNIPVFNGSSQFVEIPHHDDFLLAAGTVSLWFRTTDKSRSQGLFAKDADDKGTGGHMQVYLESSVIKGKIQNATSTTTTTQSPSIKSNRWYHVAYSFSGSTTKLYLDGVLVHQLAHTGGIGTTSGGSGNYQPIAIGCRTNDAIGLTTNGWHSPLGGTVYHVAVFPRALTDAEVTGLFNAGNPNRPLKAIPGSWKQVVQ